MFAVTPPIRVLGSLVAWFLFSTAITLLIQVSIVVMALGGSCAEGGPYVIETPCPPGVGLLAPLSIFAGIIGVAVALIFARGFGSAVEVLAWPILFVGLGLAFLYAGTRGSGPGAYVIAAVFILMGGVPMIWAVRVSGLRFLLGSRSAGGMDFTPPRDRRSSPFASAVRIPADHRPPRAADWAASLSISVIASTAGVLLGLAWFSSAAAG